jgi:4-amino-4-deoxy-L-arabinose transferase-like glycosyltransferase
MKKYVALAVFLTVVGLSFRLILALSLPNDEPDDGRLYARIAINILEHRSYSTDAEEPFSPTLIRVPGYPLLIAGVYAAFGRDNNRAVRVIQAMLDAITCWLIALLALVWAPTSWPREKRRRLLLIALAMAVLCPFPAIYVTTILTETCAILMTTGCALAASLAINSLSRAKSVAWWALSGLSGGLAAMFRPDSVIFIAAVGSALVLLGLYRAILRWRSVADRSSVAITESPRRVLVWTCVCGMALTGGVAAVIAPWTIRNARVIGVFQPIAPQYANMPGEFVPHGYIDWLRTWVDDVKYTQTFEFRFRLG